LGGTDPSGYVYFLDDGRSFLVPENGLGPTDAIQVIDSHKDVPELDWPAPTLVTDRSAVGPTEARQVNDSCERAVETGAPKTTEHEEPCGLDQGPPEEVTITFEISQATMGRLRAAAAKTSFDEFALADAIDEAIDGDSLFDATISAVSAAVRGYDG
jgi:hypothetical protein